MGFRNGEGPATAGAEGEARNVSNSTSSSRRSRPSTKRDQGASISTIEALMFSLRERGKSALTSSDTDRRLSELSPDQLAEMIVRLDRLRSKYPAVTDELLVLLGEKICDV